MTRFQAVLSVVTRHLTRRENSLSVKTCLRGSRFRDFFLQLSGSLLPLHLRFLVDKMGIVLFSYSLALECCQACLTH